jgi:hypothetical protein
LATAHTGGDSSLLHAYESDIAIRARKVDSDTDVEFVDVEGIPGPGLALDDPHSSSFWDDDDQPHTDYEGDTFTKFNHFIDVRAQRGKFDDYDGYSFAYGSASKDEFQDASEAVNSAFGKILAKVLDKKVDNGLAYYFGDEYIHASCHRWYRYQPKECSPALDRYSFPANGRTVQQELALRFPLASSIANQGCGFPYSVFMPVDNLARYWFEQYVSHGGNRDCLGTVLHGVQDAAVVHHAAGCCGNWHGHYEADIEDRIIDWVNDPTFIADAANMLKTFCAATGPAPASLLWNNTPNPSWSIDGIVTWMALNAYKSYGDVYAGFSKGYVFDEKDARRLAIFAAAVSGLALVKALLETGVTTSKKLASPLSTDQIGLAFAHPLPNQTPQVLQLALTNTSGNVVRITGIERKGQDFSMDQGTLPRDVAPGATTSIAVRYSPVEKPRVSKHVWLGYPSALGEIGVLTEGDAAPLRTGVFGGGLPTRKSLDEMKKRTQALTSPDPNVRPMLDALDAKWNESSKLK